MLAVAVFGKWRRESGGVVPGLKMDSRCMEMVVGLCGDKAGAALLQWLVLRQGRDGAATVACAETRPGRPCYGGSGTQSRWDWWGAI